MLKMIKESPRGASTLRATRAGAPKMPTTTPRAKRKENIRSVNEEFDPPTTH